jgi:hypothetical protein
MRRLSLPTVRLAVVAQIPAQWFGWNQVGGTGILRSCFWVIECCTMY